MVSPGDSRFIYRLTTDGAFYAWNSVTNSFEKLNNDEAAGYTSKIQHEVKLAEDINAGQAVYVSGVNGNSGTNMLVSKASNNTEQTSSKTLGVLVSSGVTNDLRQIITEGLLEGLDTSTATAGDPIWLGTNGNLIFGLLNKPVAPAHLVFIGIVTRVQQNNGEIFVKIQNGYEIEELHNVLITNKQNGQILMFDSATGLWKNQAETQADYNITDAISPGFIKNKPTVTEGVGVPIGTATIGSIYIEEDLSGHVLATYVFDGTNWIQNSSNQVQANWTEADTSSDAYIKNKPTLASVATSGDYSSLLNKPIIPAAQIQSDYTQTDSAQLDYIKNKPDLSIYELLINKGEPGGYVPLNSSGTIDSQFLSIEGTEYRGTWNASTNTPTIVNGSGINGNFYYVQVGGSIDLGDGVIDFIEGNIVIYDNVSNQWKRVGGQTLITNDLSISQTDFTDNVVYYYGGNTDNGDWQINKWVVLTNIKTIATQTNNGAYLNLTSAWSNKTTLNYI